MTEFNLAAIRARVKEGLRINPDGVLTLTYQQLKVLLAEVARFQKEVGLWNDKLDNAEERVVTLERENERLRGDLEQRPHTQGGIYQPGAIGGMR